MGNPMKVEVPPSIAVNSVFAALCEKLGFDPVAKTPELMAARRAIISLLKARGRVEQLTAIDWSQPIEFMDGTEAQLYEPSGRRVVGIKQGHGWFSKHPEVKKLVKGAELRDNWKVYVDAFGFGSNGRQIVRNVRENEWIEWEGTDDWDHKPVIPAGLKLGDVRFRDGSAHESPCGVSGWRWTDEDAESDIVAYKIER